MVFMSDIIKLSGIKKGAVTKWIKLDLQFAEPVAEAVG